ncbi:MAG: hypothetical protein GY820_43220 [Gammaproteobacteria bacterium]|nr:hypothetical protein [Gammaproteobacteria bacterium]
MTNFGRLLLVADWSYRKQKKNVTITSSRLQHIQSSSKSVWHKLSYARQNVAPVEIFDFGAKNGAAKKIANGPAEKNSEQMEDFWVNQTRRFHFR